MKEADIDCAEEKDIGVYVHVAKGGRYLGYVHLKDQLKENSHSFIRHNISIFEYQDIPYHRCFHKSLL